ncbi:hypothetical protein ACIPPJ_08745 [Streptomyces sp. NPDC086091]|uniref:hypothetical protein n=1 Tax=Streptomyces sp. NPDC086091 TaxID=3365751 RepID=UPI0037F987FE
MHRLVSPSRSAGPPARVPAVLGGLAVVLLAAFVLAPGPLASIGTDGSLAERDGLVAAVREVFVGYWRSGGPGFSPELERVVDYWFRYHMVKAVLAALLLAVFAALGTHLWRAFLRAGAVDADGAGKTTGATGRGTRAGRRVALASGGTLVTGLGLLSLLTVMANIQGAAAPFSSLLPLLPTGARDRELSGTVGEVRRGLAGSASESGAARPPALTVMVDDFSRYHVAMAVIATVVALTLVVLAVRLVAARRGLTAAHPADLRTRRLLTVFGALTAVTALAVSVVVAANTTTAADPAPALLAFFDGGW